MKTKGKIALEKCIESLRSKTPVNKDYIKYFADQFKESTPVVGRELLEDFRNWFNRNSNGHINDQRVDEYLSLHPVNIATDEDISKIALALCHQFYDMESHQVIYLSGYIDGAKAMRDGLIPISTKK